MSATMYDEVCSECGFTLAEHVGNTGCVFPCWTPSGLFAPAPVPAAPAPEADDTPTWLLEQQRKDDHETVVLGIIAAPEWLDADGVRGMLIDLLGECDDATLGRMAALCITRYAPPSPTAEPEPDEASREYPF